MHHVVISTFISELRWWGIATTQNREVVFAAVQGHGPIDSLEDATALIHALCGQLSGLYPEDVSKLGNSVNFWVGEQARTLGFV